MTPDTCPYCGAKRTIRGILQTYYACGTAACAKDGEPSFGQSDNCARYVRTRISQLRRMERIVRILANCHRYLWRKANATLREQSVGRRKEPRYRRLADAILREIDRLRGAA